MKRFLWIVAFALTSAHSAQAGFYLHPKAGAVIPFDGDTRYSVGAAIGYQWTSFLATEVSYARLFGGPTDGDLVEGTGIVSLPLGLLRPYAQAGVGFIHLVDTDLLYLFGAGISAHLLPFLSIGVGVNYVIVDNNSDFIEPSASIGLSF